MAEGVWKGVYPYVFGRSKQLSLNKFFDPSTPSMRKGCDGGKNGGKKGGKKEENTDENSGHYVIASNRPPERRPLERRTLAPIICIWPNLRLCSQPIPKPNNPMYLFIQGVNCFFFFLTFSKTTIFKHCCLNLEIQLMPYFFHTKHLALQNTS